MQPYTTPMKETTTMSVKEDIHSQILGGLANATFPIKTPEELLAAFPAGADTKCKSGDCEVTAGEAGKLLKPRLPIRE
jgi:hypothetical protein